MGGRGMMDKFERPRLTEGQISSRGRPGSFGAKARRRPAKPFEWQLYWFSHLEAAGEQTVCLGGQESKNRRSRLGIWKSGAEGSERVGPGTRKRPIECRLSHSQPRSRRSGSSLFAGIQRPADRRPLHGFTHHKRPVRIVRNCGHSEPHDLTSAFGELCHSMGGLGTAVMSQTQAFRRADHTMNEGRLSTNFICAGNVGFEGRRAEPRNFL